MKVNAAKITNGTDRTVSFYTTDEKCVRIPPGESVSNVQIWESQCKELSQGAGGKIRVVQSLNE